MILSRRKAHVNAYYSVISELNRLLSPGQHSPPQARKQPLRNPKTM
jgi:hypothetical protein